jgi:hypothetical protein
LSALPESKSAKGVTALERPPEVRLRDSVFRPRLGNSWLKESKTHSAGAPAPKHLANQGLAPFSPLISAPDSDGPLGAPPAVTPLKAPSKRRQSTRKRPRDVGTRNPVSRPSGQNQPCRPYKTKRLVIECQWAHPRLFIQNPGSTPNFFGKGTQNFLRAIPTRVVEIRVATLE